MFRKLRRGRHYDGYFHVQHTNKSAEALIQITNCVSISWVTNHTTGDLPDGGFILLQCTTVDPGPGCDSVR